MLLDRTERFVVSSLGWVDGGACVRRDLGTGDVLRVEAGESDFVRISDIDGDRFLIVGYMPARGSLSLSVRRFAAPLSPLWSMLVTPSSVKVTGDTATAAGMRRHHVASLHDGKKWRSVLVTVGADGTSASLGSLPWFNEATYDLSYQGLTDAVALPESELVLVSVQRSSTIVIHDPRRAEKVGEFVLADRRGNPNLWVVGNELWTIDYDTFVRVNLSSCRVEQSDLISPAPGEDPKTGGNVRAFSGNLFHWVAKSRVAIPRPFWGDVAIVAPGRRGIESLVAVGGQPLSCAVTAAGRLVVRDWKSGEWSEGTAQVEGRER